MIQNKYNQLFIGGKWVKPSKLQLIDVRSPHDQSLVGQVAEAFQADVDKAVATAVDAFNNGPWLRMKPEERQAVIERFNELYSAKAEEFAL